MRSSLALSNSYKIRATSDYGLECSGPSRPKIRRKDENWMLKYGFLAVNGRPQCVLCSTTLASTSMKSAKLQKHLMSKHPGEKNETEEFFHLLAVSTQLIETPGPSSTAQAPAEKEEAIPSLAQAPDEWKVLPSLPMPATSTPARMQPSNSIGSTKRRLEINEKSEGRTEALKRLKLREAIKFQRTEHGIRMNLEKKRIELVEEKERLVKQQAKLISLQIRNEEYRLTLMLNKVE